MKKSILLLFSALFGMALASCGNKTITGSGNFIKRTYDIPEADSLELSDIRIKNGDGLLPVTLVVDSADEPSISITGQENVLDHIFVEETLNGGISISGKNGYEYSTESLVVHVSGYAFEEMDLSLTNATVSKDSLQSEALVDLSMASRMILDSYSGDSLTMILDGSSQFFSSFIEAGSTDFSLSNSSMASIGSIKSEESVLTCQSKSTAEVSYDMVSKISIQASGASVVSASGTAESADLVYSAASIFYGKKLSLTQTDIVLVSGTPDLYVRCSERITIVSASAGTITYYGSPMVNKNSITDSTVIVQGEE